MRRPGFGAAAFNRAFGRGWLLFGFAFLYVPIVALVVYSFNDSPIANVWRGFTLKWYTALASDRELLAGLALSLKIAFATACASVVLGTLAAFALTRYRRFFGRSLFAGMVAAPLGLRGIIGCRCADDGVAAARHRGLVRRRLTERGMLTIWLGHCVGMAYGRRRAGRLQTLNPQPRSGDGPRRPPWKGSGW